MLVALHPELAPVDEGVGPLLDALVNVAPDLCQVLGRDQRAHLDTGLGARADLELANAQRPPLDQGMGRLPAHRHRHRNRHAALAGRAVAGAHQGIDRHVEVGVGHHHHLILGSAQRLHALARCGTSPVDVLGHRRGADEADRGDARMGQDRADRGLAAIDHRDDPRRHAGLDHQLGERPGTGRVALGGLRMNALPQAIATGIIHNGTMAGKLNGVMPAQTPTGCRAESRSTPAPT